MPVWDAHRGFANYTTILALLLKKRSICSKGRVVRGNERSLLSASTTRVFLLNTHMASDAMQSDRECTLGTFVDYSWLRTDTCSASSGCFCQIPAGPREDTSYWNSGVSCQRLHPSFPNRSLPSSRLSLTSAPAWMSSVHSLAHPVLTMIPRTWQQHSKLGLHGEGDPEASMPESRW